MKFNKLLQAKAELMCQISSAPGAVSVPVPNGSHNTLLHQNASCYAPDNTVQAMQSAVGMTGLSRRDDVSQNLRMPQNSNMGLMQGMNGGGVIKSESGYPGEPSFMYNAANNGIDRPPAMTEVPVLNFLGEETHPKPVNEPIVDPDTSSFGFLGQIPRNFSLSDLTADFSISSDILDNYSRSPYLAADTDFLNSHGNGNIQDGKRLDTISEGLSYEGFGSD
ncbi:hypothetical protein CTI12_AA580890 [Artemisia annua]|uniref:Uncharacterized protein n=1 Tax=Artemisia annua TaxID=35608 RepID=A0A2U1KP56_ARTAN|nr:hypothetical protein CTI12_AA580890 [Artemisia annua]